MTFTPNYNLRVLLDSYTYIGHNTSLWNAKMKEFIYGVNNNTHILNLKKTAIHLCNALQKIFNIISSGEHILFVNTKKNSHDIIVRSALACDQPYVSHRWLGGTLTNWATVSSSLRTIKYYDKILNRKNSSYTKKELLGFKKRKDKLDLTLGGMKNVRGKIGLVFIIDTQFHKIATAEAQKAKIPVISIVDSNSSPRGVDYIIPSNDDSRKSINLYCSLIAEAIVIGTKFSKYKGN